MPACCGGSDITLPQGGREREEEGGAVSALGKLAFLLCPGMPWACGLRGPGLHLCGVPGSYLPYRWNPPCPPHLFITVFVNWHECCQRQHLSSSHILEWGRFCSWMLLSNSIHCLFFFFSFSLEQKSNWSSRGAHLIWIVFTKWSAPSVRVSREVFAF